jgi:hypothetical protein
MSWAVAYGVTTQERGRLVREGPPTPGPPSWSGRGGGGGERGRPNQPPVRLLECVEARADLPRKPIPREYVRLPSRPTDQNVCTGGSEPWWSGPSRKLPRVSSHLSSLTFRPILEARGWDCTRTAKRT